MKTIMNLQSSLITGFILLIMTTCCLVLNTSDTEASHFRYGNISWTNSGGPSSRTATFRVTQAWRRSAFGNPNVGSIINGGSLNFGDATSANINITVTSINVAEDWFFGEATIVKTYTGTGTSFVTFFTTCCRIGGLGNSGSTFRVESTVNFGNGNSSPLSSVPAIVNMATGLNPATFLLPASDPNGNALTFSLATSAQMGSGAQPVGLSVNPTTGLVSFNTVGKPVGGLWYSQIRISDGAGATIAVDFIIKIIALTTPPVYNYSVTPANGTIYKIQPGNTLTYTVRAQDSDPGDIVTLSAVNLPSGSTHLPALVTSGNPVQSVFSWTPTMADIGARVVTYTAQDINSTQTFTSVTIIVSLDPVFNVPPTPAIGSAICIEPAEPYLQTIQAITPNPGGTVQLSIAPASVPAGAVFSPGNTSVPGSTTNLTLNWTPVVSQWGPRTLPFVATDNFSNTTTHSFDVIVNSHSAFTSTPVTSINALYPYVYNIVVQDDDLPYGDVLDIYASGLPAWLTMVQTGPGTATLSGTPAFADSGNHIINLYAEDLYHHFCPQTFQFFTLQVIPCTTLVYADTDMDGFGNPAVSIIDCNSPSGYVSNNTDCNDNNGLVYQSATLFIDVDGDGYDVGTAVVCYGAAIPAGYSTTTLGIDCNDNNIAIYQSGTFYTDVDGDNYDGGSGVVCYGATLPSIYKTTTLGNDCNDNDVTVQVPLQYFVDADHDSYGSTATAMVCSSTATLGYSTNNTDCNDANAAIHPGASEICNNIDDDCDALIDDLDPSVSGRPVWYADTDLDGFGDLATATPACIQPAGYISNSTDCDDTDANEYPGQVWYIDNDGDDYGTGATVTQCLRPSNGYLAAELTSTTGDCNDNNASINPVSQTLTFSGVGNFVSELVSPLNGTGYTNFTFEVVYTDATNALPPATFPRALLDYEGNNVFNNINDRVVIMNPYDANDLTTSDGKRYIGTINSLTAGTNWQSRIQVVNGACITQIGPINSPDVLVLPDLQIFANDITFSSANPAISSPQTVTAIIHNVSDFPAQNFYVHLLNQYDNTSPADILVSNLAPHASTTVSWTITTPAVPAWCPIQVSVDFTNVIDESNELDNSALRPFINGNFNLPGGIDVLYEASSPSVAYVSTGASTTISGRGVYYGTPLPLADPSVAGGTVTFTIVETGATFTTNTNSQGYFSLSVPSPLAIGTYNVNGSLTDFTLTGNFSTSFTIIPPPACQPDLRAFVSLSSNYIVAGNSINGSITVSNYGCTATTVPTVLDLFQTGGSPALNDVTVPPLAAGASFTTTFSNMLFSTPGSYSICGTADATYLVAESNESNNTDCKGITVIPAMPDIYPSGGPYGSSYLCNVSPGAGFTVSNGGGAATGPFTCEVVVKLNSVVINTFTQPISNIAAFGSTSFSLPVVFSSLGNYTFEIACDIPVPGGIVVETNESNNTATYSKTILNCLPDLVFSSCESFDVQPVDPQFPGTVTYTATLSNSGNATAFAPITVRFQLSGGTFYDTQYNNNLAPGQSTIVSVNAPSVAPATQTLSAIADPSNAIAEWNESNTITNSLCWDFQPVPMYWPCGSNFWQQTYLVNQTAYLSVGMTSGYLYDASSVKMRFQVSGPGLAGTITLGDAFVNNVEQTCGCPRTAFLPTPFAFPQVGTYTFTMTADPDGDYTECAENNNVLVVNVVVTAVPDLRILSQYIDPSMLNPQPGQLITMDITYDNLGISNINDQMELKVLVDEIPLDSVYPVNGLVSGDNITIAIPETWSSTSPGTHVIRAIIDSDNQIVESNESNNQATRAVIVGEAANLYFQVFASSNPTPALHDVININARIGNNGDLACAADVQFFYVTNSLDTILIGTLPVNVGDNDSTTISLPWSVLDPATTLIGKIINSSTLEFTYDDNQASTIIGAMVLSLTPTPSCNGGADGTLTANIAGGESPYSVTWSNSFNGTVLTAGAGTYTVTVIDNTGQMVTGSGIIANDPGVVYFADADSDTYGNAAVTQISCSGAPSGFVANDDDCDDTNAAVNPAATEVCNTIDDDCDGFIDNNDPSLSDTELPTITCIATISVNNDANTCGAVVTFASPSFNDNCSGATLAQTAGLASGSAFPVGTTTNTFVVTDFSGNTATCSFDVVVTDAQNPVITCGADISLIATSASGAAVTYAAPVGTDNCPGATTALTSGYASNATFPIGITTVTYTVTDAAGLTSSCSFTVDVTGLPPQIACPAGITVNNTPGSCGANVSYSATETTGIPASTITYSHTPGSYFPVGTTTVTATATNPVGTSVCTFDVIVDDDEDPTLTLPANITVGNDANACGAVVAYSTSFNDNCTGSSISQTAGLASGSVFPIGTTTNTFVVTDAAGNTTTNSFTVTVNDISNPSLTCPAGIITANDPGNCGAVVTYTVPFSDNCPGATIAQTAGLASGAQFPVGTTTNTFVVTDASGNTATCSFTVTVNDDEDPSLTLPANITVGNDANACGAVVSYSTSFNDNCTGSSISQTAGLASGSVFPVGTTTITFVVTDAAGNTTTNSFTVTVNDISNPTLTCPAAVVTANDPGNCSAIVTYTVPFNDNCPGATIAQTAGLASGSQFPVGTTTNTFVVTDASGNTATCSFTVTVNDDEDPTLSIPANIVTGNDAGVCGAAVTYAVTFNDNCSGSTIAQTTGLASGSFFPEGTTVNTFVVTDAAGNTATNSFTVIVNDVSNPEVNCPGNITSVNDPGQCGAVVTYSVPFSDNCPGATITRTTGFASGSQFPVGVTTNTFVVTDASGNSATCSFTVTVNDNQLPVISCPSNMNTVVNTSGCLAVVNYSLPSFSDNCPGATITQTAGLASGSAFPLGVTTNTFVVTDAAGNTATCSFTVTITNSTPIITSLVSSAGPIFPVNTATTMTATWGDEANGGPYTVTFIWNDGTANTVLTGVSGSTASAAHTYNSSAVFEPSVRVTDACGSISAVVSGTSTYQYLAVYVVGSQFTTMGGWYNTPAGSLMSNPSFVGKVNMGNVVKPLSGAFKGELELNIKDQNIKIHAVNPTTWDYLTISGCCYAQFRGSCKVNNVTGYKVLVAQTDINYSCGTYGGNNMIRVKVWNTTTGQVIYDTQPGAPDNALPTLPLNGGAIQVHTQNNCVARIIAPDFEVKCYPNPANDLLNVDVISDQEQMVKLHMFDVTGRMVYQNELPAVIGSNNNLIDVSSMMRGVYFIEINGISGIQRVKVVLD